MDEYNNTMNELSIDELMDSEKQDFNDFMASISGSDSPKNLSDLTIYGLMESEKQAFNNFMASQLSDRDGYNNQSTSSTIYEDSSTPKSKGGKLISENKIYEFSRESRPAFDDLTDNLVSGFQNFSYPMCLNEFDNIGKYNIDYDALIVKKRGPAYRADKITSKSYYYRTPGSPIHGDVSKEIQINSIDALINSSVEHGLSLHETAYVLAIAKHESGFNPYAAAGTTTAVGLGQFIDSTGKGYDITESNMWDITIQAEALVRHFQDNQRLAKSRGQSEVYIYKYHHDGPTYEYGGLKLAKKFVMPEIRGIKNAISKIF